MESIHRRGHLAEALNVLRKGYSSRPTSSGDDAGLRLRLLETEILIDSGSPTEAAQLVDSLPVPRSAELRVRQQLLRARLRIRLKPAETGEARSMLDDARMGARAAGAAALEGRIELSASLTSRDAAETDRHMARALELGRQNGDAFLETSALCDTGYHRFTRGRFDEAIYWLEQARALAAAKGFDLLLERTVGNLGWCHYSLGDNDRALDLYSQAELLAAQLGDRDTRYRWLSNMGGVYMRQGERTKAAGVYRRALQFAEAAGNKRWQAIVWNNLSENALGMGDVAGARAANAHALEIKRALGDKQSLAHSQWNEARILQAEGHKPEAERALLDLIPVARAEQVPAVLWRSHADLAALYRAGGRKAEAGKHYRAALSTIDHEWSRLNRDEYKVTFLAPLISFYQDYVDFLAADGEWDRALEAVAAAKARVLAERMGVPTRTVADFTALSRRTGLVLASYWIAPGRSFLWVVSPRRTAHFTLPGAGEIDQLAADYSAAIAAGYNPLQRENRAGRRLAEILLDPVRQMAPPGARVALVPDGGLHQLNFETLVVDPARPHYWIEDVTLELAPSLNVLERAPQWPGSPALLLLGDPVPFDPAFPALPEAAREVAALEEQFPPTRRSVYSREQATPQAYRESAPARFDLIHFAAHASANRGRPLESAVILSRRGDAYKLYAGEVMDLPIKARLVTLSACRSAGSRAFAGEGMIGFAWAFLQAGAHNVIAGLWDVDDTAARETMVRLYRRLKAGEPAAAALRAAKCELLNAGERFARPYYWGPFQVYTRAAE